MSESQSHFNTLVAPRVPGGVVTARQGSRVERFARDDLSHAALMVAYCVHLFFYFLFFLILPILSTTRRLSLLIRVGGGGGGTQLCEHRAAWRGLHVLLPGLIASGRLTVRQPDTALALIRTDTGRRKPGSL